MLPPEIHDFVGFYLQELGQMWDIGCQHQYNHILLWLFRDSISFGCFNRKREICFIQNTNVEIVIFTTGEFYIINRLVNGRSTCMFINPGLQQRPVVLDFDYWTLSTRVSPQEFKKEILVKFRNRGAFHLIGGRWILYNVWSLMVHGFFY